MKTNRWQSAAALFLALAIVAFGVTLLNRDNAEVPIATPPTVNSDFHGATLDPVEPAPDIELTDHRGQPFRLSDEQGRAVVLFFGFTSCPDVCPTTMAHFKQVKQHLADDADNVRFVMISVDPERDTHERMAQYVEAFDPDFIGLTGSLEEMQAVWADYDVFPEKVEAPNSALGYSVTHPAWTYVVDPAGNLRLLHFYGLPADVVAHDLQLLLREAGIEPIAKVDQPITVERAWARPAPQGGNGAVYFDLVNHSGQPITLVSAETAVAEVTEIHETRLIGDDHDEHAAHHDDHADHQDHADHHHDHADHHHDHGDNFIMLHVDSLVVPARGQVAFTPAGRHVMLIGLEKTLAWGETFDLTLNFLEASPVTVQVTVGDEPGE